MKTILRYAVALRSRADQMMTRLRYRVVRLWHSRRLARALSDCDREFLSYAQHQVDRSLPKFGTSHRDPQENGRKTIHAAAIADSLDCRNLTKALVIGCRNSVELDLLEELGVKSVRGIDLFSRDSRVSVMAMENLQFADGEFDLVYSSHSLEHSYDVESSIREFCRVLGRPGYVFVEVPIAYPTDHVDRVDFKSAAALVNRFRAASGSVAVIFARDIPPMTEDNPCGTSVARILLRLEPKDQGITREGIGTSPG